MTEEKILKVTQPKVEGSIHLDELFPENTLDFFVFFSSIASVVGNDGQSNYSAANAFMASLAEQRRRRGLAASIINIGPILGVGYIAREDLQSKMRADLLQRGYVTMAEQDFLQLFAEGVVAGRPGSTGPIEITTGFRDVNPAAPVHPVWFSNPLMGHFVLHGEARDQVIHNKKAKLSLKSQLEQAKTSGEVYDLVITALLSKICALFQLDPDTSSSQNDSMKKMRLDQLGIDSLLAVEIRSWFMTTLDVNIPVLKLLNGISISELADIALENLTPVIIPKLDLEVTSSSVQSNDHPTLICEGLSPLHVPVSSSYDSSSDENKLTSTPSTPFSTLAEDTLTTPSLPIVTSFAKLSFSQAMFWFVSLFLEDKTGLNHTACFRLTGKLRIEDFQRAVRDIGQRHEALRTSFLTVDDEPVQGIMDSSVLNLERRDINK